MPRLPRPLLFSLILLLSFTGRADSWVHHLPFSGVDNIAETSGRVYFTSLGALYAYDKKHRETLVLSPRDCLNDVDVTGIYPSPHSGTVAVTYSSGNIDIVRDNSDVVNLPDIMTSRLAPHDIYSVAFHPSEPLMYVATGFGVVLFDLQSAAVKAHVRFPQPVTSVLFHDSAPVISTGGRYYRLADSLPFEKSGSWIQLPAFRPQSPASGTVTIPSSIHADCHSAMRGSSEVWIGNADGLFCYDLSSTSPAVVAGPIRPGEMSVADVNMLRVEPSGTLYIATRGNSNVHVNRSTGNIARLCRLSPDGVFSDLTPAGLTHYFEKQDNPDGRLLDLTFIREDPADPSLHYVGSLSEGMYAMNGRDEIRHFYTGDSPFLDNWGVRVMDLAFDPRGGMWAYSEAPDDTPMMFFLPQESRSDIAAVTRDDWKPVSLTAGVVSGRDCTAVVSRDGRYIYSMGSADIYIYDTAGTSSLADDTGHWARTFVTADQAVLPVTRVCSITEDPADRSLWIGTDIGVLVAPRPWEAADGTISVSRPVVRRDDGTSLADYLLSGEYIYGIAVDPLGNKWIATQASGAFLVSPDGTGILLNHTSDNSPLPSDEVRAVACRDDGTVFFGTRYGLLEYQSDVRPGAHDYSEVTIYPNPVRPDYHGDVIIDGLVDRSVILILDSGGALVARLKSEGGRIRWNPRAAARPLPSGVYHVIASSPTSSGRPVGKIAIIR